MLRVRWALLLRPLTGQIDQRHIKRKPDEFGLTAYPTEAIQILKLERVIQDKIHSAKTLIVSNVRRLFSLMG